MRGTLKVIWEPWIINKLLFVIGLVIVGLYHDSFWPAMIGAFIASLHIVFPIMTYVNACTLEQIKHGLKSTEESVEAYRKFMEKNKS